MNLLSISSELSAQALSDDFIKSVVIANSSERALMFIEDYVYKSPEYRNWLYEFIETDIETTNHRLINDVHAIAVISKRILKKINRALAVVC